MSPHQYGPTPNQWSQEKHFPRLVPLEDWEALYEDAWAPVVAIAVDGDGALIAVVAPLDEPVVVVRNLRMRRPPWFSLGEDDGSRGEVDANDRGQDR